jgi:hypothetical protein
VRAVSKIDGGSIPVRGVRAATARNLLTALERKLVSRIGIESVLIQLREILSLNHSWVDTTRSGEPAGLTSEQ